MKGAYAGAAREELAEVAYEPPRAHLRFGGETDSESKREENGGGRELEASETGY